MTVKEYQELMKNYLLSMIICQRIEKSEITRAYSRRVKRVHQFSLTIDGF